MVGADGKGHKNAQRAGAGRSRLHVEHVFDAVDLLFERCRTLYLAVEFDGARGDAVVGRVDDIDECALGAL